MTLIRNLLLVGAMLLAWVPARAGGVPQARNAPIAISGVYSVVFHVNLASTLPAGSILTCRARMAPIPGGVDLRNQMLSATPVALGQTRLTGSTAACTAEIPFSWTVTSPPNAVELFYEIEVVNLQGVAPTLLRSSAPQQTNAAFLITNSFPDLTLNLTF